MMMPIFGSHGKAVLKKFFAETVSINMVMTRMIPTIVVLAATWPESDDQLTLQFWFGMCLANVVGAVVAFPINRWLVANRLKLGCMTLPGADGPAPALWHVSLEHNETADHEGHQMAGHHQMKMMNLSVGRAAAWIVATCTVLIVALWLRSKFVPIKF